jgi:cytochrome c-type biogenesis protein CcmH
MLFAGIAALALVAAGFGYWWTSLRAGGSTAAVATAQPDAVAAHAGMGMGSGGPAMASSAPHGTGSDQMMAMTDRLAERLKKQPQDAEGWAMLARTYSVLGRPAEAIKAYEKAVALRKDDAMLLADYADILAVQNNRQLAGEPLRLVERALQIEPGNLKALSMAGSAAFDRQDFAKAVQYWEQVVALAPPEHPMAQQIRPSLEQARALSGKPAQAPRGTKLVGLAKP